MHDLHFDFAAALVLMTLVSGVIWLADKLWLARRRQNVPEGVEPRKAHWLVEFARSFFPVILAVLILRSFVVEPFRIPSTSMLPTLHTGDFILVNKFAYGFRMPVTHQVILPWDKPERGDVAVFRFPPDPTKDFIKRIVGLPGDEIAYRDRKLYINGELAPLRYQGIYSGPGISPLQYSELYLEQLEQLNHEVLFMPRRASPSFRVQVPQGHYFAMGDNRDNSDDSRRWGFVPEENLVGEAFLIWMSWDYDNNRPAFSRIGMTVE